MAPSRSSSKAPPPPCHYPSLGQATAVLCGLDMLITTLLLLCNTGSPVFSDFGHLWQSQVCSKYRAQRLLAAHPRMHAGAQPPSRRMAAALGDYTNTH